MLLDKIKNKINKADIVSFDIFDTLLLRPYCKPSDLFYHIGQVKKMPFFATLRQETERETRIDTPTKEDITFEEIYQNIDDVFKPFQKIEMDWEEMVLRANPELKQVYDYTLSQNKKVIVTSDMYLPTDFLAQLLRKNGFDGWDKIYISGDIGLTKASGNLFKKIIDEFSPVSAEKILHIGDNKHSDYKIPQKLGIQSILYQQVVKQFLKENKAFAYLYDETKYNLGLSILLSVLAYRWQIRRCHNKRVPNYWNELGYLYAGPLAYGYCRFVEDVAKEQKLDFLGFVARDGYTLQKIFNRLCPNIKTAYIYAPRFLNLICRLDYARRNKEQTNAIITYFSKNNNKIRKLLNNKDLMKAKEQHQFIQGNRELFVPEAKKNMENYKKYIKSLIPDNSRVGIVDTITGEFSSQKLLQSALGRNIHGIYWSVLLQVFQGIYDRSCFINKKSYQHDASVYTRNWNFIEFLLTSPEYPIKNMDSQGKPVYDSNPNEAEKYRAKIYPDISEGAIQFTKDIQSIFNGNDIFLDGESLVKYINNFVDHPQSIDIREMSKIKFGVDSNHSTYVPLFSENISLKEYLFHPKKVMKRIKYVLWQTPMQSLFTCFIKPISIRTKGLKQIEISLFPYLGKQYFTAILNISSTCYYKFVIGHK